MASATSTARTVGIALLTLTSMAAGFMAATVDTGDPLTPSGTIDRADRAWGLDLVSGQQARLSVPSGADGARFAVYDPADRFFDQFALADGESVTVVADETGRWVLVPTAPLDGNLTVRTSTGSNGTSPADLTPLPLRHVERTVLEQAEGDLDERIAMRLDRRPALAYLRASGTAEGLEATLSSDAGRVFHLEMDHLNGTRSLGVGPGEESLSPGNLVPGTYRLEAKADRFEGELELVHSTYARSSDEPAVVNASLPGLEEQGLPIAAMEEGQAFLVDPQGADRIVFAAAHDTTSRVRVYGEDDDVLRILGLGPQEGYRWEFGPESQTPQLETAEVAVDPSSTYVVYIPELAGHGERVYALLPGLRTAEPATALEIRETRMHLGAGTVTTDDSNQVAAELDGALVEIDLEVEDTASTSHRVRVSGPNGLVLVHEERTSAAGVTVERRHQENPSHFSDGRFQVRVDESYTVDGDTWVTLKHYER